MGQQVLSKGCTTSHLTAFEIEKIVFSTSSPEDFEALKMIPVNATAGEQWEFDDFRRRYDGLRFWLLPDPNFAILDSWNLCFSREVGYTNGVRFALFDSSTDFVIEQCSQRKRGLRGSCGGGRIC